ncbi:uncharacterized protein LOC144453723 isoform X3 [Glandiceps talaboti]
MKQSVVLLVTLSLAIISICRGQDDGAVCVFEGQEYNHFTQIETICGNCLCFDGEWICQDASCEIYGCPPVFYDQNVYGAPCPDLCNNDDSCLNGMKCCGTVCGRECVQPIVRTYTCTDNHSCQNGATCTITDQYPYFMCLCPNGFTGRLCESRLTVCEHGSTRQEDCNTCYCSNGQWACTEMGCPQVNCEHEGQLYTQGSTRQEDCNTCFCSNGQWACTEMGCPQEVYGCPPVFYDQNMYGAPCPDLCNDDDSCLDGMKCCGTVCGQQCVQPIVKTYTCTDNHSCQNGATCTITDQYPYFMCHCPNGFTGRRCESRLTVQVCPPVFEDMYDACADTQICEGDYSCDNGMKCCSTSSRCGHSCIQPVNNGSMCEAGHPCENGATCIVIGGSPHYKCLCLPGLTGTHCNECPFFNPCRNGATCSISYIGGLPTFNCYCPNGYSGQHCEQPVVCEHGSTRQEDCNTCTCSYGQWVCTEMACLEETCPPVYTVSSSMNCVSNCRPGDTCGYGQMCCFNGGCMLCLDKVTVGSDCAAGHPCMNGATCKVVGSVPNYECQCPLPFMGTHCEQRYDVDPCSCHPCLNGATCYNSHDGNTYFCVCPGGYIGTQCEIVYNPCDSNPCMNGGTCGMSSSTLQCICPINFSGMYCENHIGVQVCPPVFEGMSGICVEMCQGDYSCSSGMKCCFNGCGHSCMQPVNNGSLCAGGHPCMNSATCIVVGGSPINYKCLCPPGFMGMHCDQGYGYKPGQCPPIPEPEDRPGMTDESVYCQHTCTNDYGCEGTKKCCMSTYCGMVCTEVEGCDYYQNRCQNGGSCVMTPGAIGGYCTCTDGFTGNLCEQPIGYKPGQCPPIPEPEDRPGMTDESVYCQHTCTNDYGCEGTKKCCMLTNCGMVCTEVEGYGCDLGNNQCLNGGTCLMSTTGMSYCLCEDWFTGVNCETALGCDYYQNRCQNGGRCVMTPGAIGGYCTCTDGFTGNLCEQPIERGCDYVHNICRNGGTCMMSQVGIHSFCVCTPQFSGEHCEMLISVQVCPPVFEGMFGHCAEMCQGDYNCSSGMKCCSIGCGHSCIQPVNNGSLCAGGHPCMNGATCIVVGGSPINYKCLCPPGFMGMHCDQRYGYKPGQCPPIPEPEDRPGMTDESLHCQHTCTNDYGCEGTKKCCMSTYCGMVCTEVEGYGCDNLVCLNGGTCTMVEYGGHAYCMCAPGFSGENCGIQTRVQVCPPVFMFGHCAEMCQGDYSCSSGMKCCSNGCGHSCIQPVNNGSLCAGGHPCMNSATCIVVGGSPINYKCLCPPGFMGMHCDQRYGCDYYQNICQNGGSCVMAQGAIGGSCTCTDGFTGNLCEQPIGYPCFVADDYCLNGGTCEMYRNGLLVCRCADGFTGVSCETALERGCDYVHNICRNGGTCMMSQVGIHSFCVCTPQFSGEHCEMPISVQVCPPVFEGMSGICAEMCQGDYSCSSGMKCCSNGCGHSCIQPVNNGSLCAGGHPCRNGATCIVVGGSPINYKCLCPTGFMGMHCDQRYGYKPGQCPPIPEPEDRPGMTDESVYCQHTCTNDYGCEGTKKCCMSTNCGMVCLEVYNPCDSNPCMHGGTCEIASSTLQNMLPHCICPIDFSGPFCETPAYNPCDSNPCMNEGICEISPTFQNMVPYCRCPIGFSGLFCETRIEVGCDYNQNRCQNGGRCVMTSGAMRGSCTCTDGFTGNLCEQPIASGICACNPCLNGGTCHDVMGVAYGCICPPEYMGKNCEWLVGSYECPTGSPRMQCMMDPCIVAKCQTNEQALCRPNMCGGCKAEFYDEQNNRVECEDPCQPNPCQNNGQCYNVNGKDYMCVCLDTVPTGQDIHYGRNCESPAACSGNMQPLTCVIDPCAVSVCPSNPNAQCRINICDRIGYDECFPEFFDEQGRVVDCYQMTCPGNMAPQRCSANPCLLANCPLHPEASCRPEPCHEDRCMAVFFDTYNNRINCEEPRQCPDGQPVVSCVINPCEVNECHANPNARCVANYCGSCTADFFDENNRKVNCEEPRPCPDGSTMYNCLVDPCQVTECPANPDARCEANYCGGCNAEFFDEYNMKVSCEEPRRCPDDQPPVFCETNPCQDIECEANPRAQCQINNCGNCTAEFFLNNIIVNCEVPTGPKPGSCPRVEEYDCEHDQDECMNDRDCIEELKCCTNGCVMLCTVPVDVPKCQRNYECLNGGTCEYGSCRCMARYYGDLCENYEDLSCVGSDGTIYADGETMMPDECNTCTCSGGALVCTLMICEHRCPDGIPATDANGLDIFCGLGPIRQECPANHFCNIAPDDRYAVCCPGSGYTCPPNEPMVECLANPCDGSECPSNADAECRPNYCGSCRAEFYDNQGEIVDCALPKHPCLDGIPATDANGLDIFCGRGPNRQECPADHFCNIAPDDTKAVCCPGSGYICPPNEPMVACLVNPCDGSECPSNADAECRPNYCGSCRAEFYDNQGEIVDCALPSPEPCRGSDNKIYADGETMAPNDCNVCTCSNGIMACTEVFCGDTTSCENSGIHFEHGQERTSDCNTCYCNFKQWVCSQKACVDTGTLVGISVSFHLEGNFAEIENKVEEFKGALFDSVVANFKVPVSMIKNLRISSGSIKVEFDIQDNSQEEVDIEAISANMEVKITEYTFVYDGKKYDAKDNTAVFENMYEEEPAVEKHVKEILIIAAIIVGVFVVLIIIAIVSCLVASTFNNNRRSKREKQYVNRRNATPRDIVHAYDNDAYAKSPPQMETENV